MAEAEVMVNKGKSKHAEKAQEKAAQAKNQGGDADDLMEHVAEQTLKHNLVLQRVYEKASESTKKGLLQAIEASQKGRENALGDGDFDPLYKLLIKMRKRVIVIYAHGHLGREIYQIKKGVYKCPIEKLGKSNLKG